MNTRIPNQYRPSSLGHLIFGAGPGLALVAGIVGVAALLHHFGIATAIGLPILSILIAMMIGNVVSIPAASAAGLRLASRPLLRFGIILLGLQVTVTQLIAMGLWPLVGLVAIVLGTMGFTLWMGRVLGVERGLSVLIASGSSICGASAVLAASSTISARDEDVAYGVATVTLFGSVAMVALPVASAMLGLGPMAHGVWAGSSIHEVAQAVAAAFQHGEVAGTVGTMVKLGRVMMLVPVLLIVATLFHRGRPESGSKRAPFPLFVLGFLAMAGANSVIEIPADLRADLGLLTACLLSLSLAAIGLQTRFSALLARGARPLLLAALSACFISGAGFLLAVQLFS